MNPLTQDNRYCKQGEQIYLDAVVEVEKGSKLKVEVEKETGIYRADRVVRVPYMEAYGFIPGTLAEDGDCLDVFVVSNEAISSGMTVRVKVVDAIHMLDKEEDGHLVADHKLIATVVGETVDVDKPAIESFLCNYKDGTVVGYANIDQESMCRMIESCMERAKS